VSAGNEVRLKKQILLFFRLPTISAAVETSAKDYLTFRLARRDLAVESTRVRGILPFAELTPVPTAREGVIGVANYSGRPVVVIDLRLRLSLTAASQGSQQRIVVVEAAGGHLAGFVADRVANIVRYRSRDLRAGVLRGAGRRRQVVEIDAVVSEDDLVRLWSLNF
jgi:chemotaxis signal transduction protein